MSRHREFYHGSRQHLEPGDLVLPARETGIHNTGSGTSYAWASPDPTFAAHYAGQEGTLYRGSPTEPLYPWDAGKQEVAKPSWRVEAPAWTPRNQDTERISRARQMKTRQEELHSTIKARLR